MVKYHFGYKYLINFYKVRVLPHRDNKDIQEIRVYAFYRLQIKLNALY